MWGTCRAVPLAFLTNLVPSLTRMSPALFVPESFTVFWSVFMVLLKSVSASDSVASSS